MDDIEDRWEDLILEKCTIEELKALQGLLNLLVPSD